MSQNKEKILAAAVALLALIVAELGSTEVTEPSAPEPETKKGKGKGKPTPAPEETKDDDGPTIESLREKASALMSDGKAADVKKLLTKFKAESITKMDPKHYAAFNDALGGLSIG